MIYDTVLYILNCSLGESWMAFYVKVFASIETHRAVCYLQRLCTLNFYQRMFNHVLKIPFVFWGGICWSGAFWLISGVLLWAPYCHVALCASVFVCADESVLSVCYGEPFLLMIREMGIPAGSRPAPGAPVRLSVSVCALSPYSVPSSGSRGISPAPATYSFWLKLNWSPLFVALGGLSTTQ